jgi:anti-anti-sigma factor
VGLDLPAAIAEAEPAIMELIPPEKRNLVKFAGVDATNYETLKEALAEETGEFCITTEGLLMYFTDSEAGMFCDNIRRLLETHGGCWITVDPEISLIYLMILKTICADLIQEIREKGQKRVAEKSDVDVGVRSLVLDVTDFQKSTMKGMAFLAKHGLKAERMIVADHLPDISSFAKTSPEQAETIKEDMKKCAIWKITLADNAKQLDTSDAGSKNFNVAAELESGMLKMSLHGRLDTITAPDLLTFYEKHKDEIKTANIDCKNLDYVSSAGLRVLLIMHKGCDGGVTLKNINTTVEEILDQTGFDLIFNIEK